MEDWLSRAIPERKVYNLITIRRAGTRFFGVSIEIKKSKEKLEWRKRLMDSQEWI